MSFNYLINKQNVIYSYSGILLNNKKNKILIHLKKMNESENNNAK